MNASACVLSVDENPFFANDSLDTAVRRPLPPFGFVLFCASSNLEHRLEAWKKEFRILAGVTSRSPAGDAYEILLTYSSTAIYSPQGSSVRCFIHAASKIESFGRTISGFYSNDHSTLVDLGGAVVDLCTILDELLIEIFSKIAVAVVVVAVAVAVAVACQMYQSSESDRFRSTVTVRIV